MFYPLKMLTCFLADFCFLTVSWRIRLTLHTQIMILYAWEGAPDVYSSCTVLHDGGSEGSKSCFISVIKQFVTFPPCVLIRSQWPRHGWSAFGVVCCVLLLKRFWHFSDYSHLNSEEADKVTGFPPSPSRCCAFPPFSSPGTSAANK